MGPRENIVGRTLVLHEKEDDLGDGGRVASLKTGDAGGRVGCGIVELQEQVKEDQMRPQFCKLNTNLDKRYFGCSARLTLDQMIKRSNDGEMVRWPM